MKTNSKLNAHILRGSTLALLISCVIVALCSAINLPEQPPKALPQQDNAAFGANGHQSTASVARTLSFADRVAYQRAIENVYWRHRIWPKERLDSKPSLDAVMSQAQLEKKVEDYLSKSQALEDYWHRPLTAEQLQAEMERMAQHTKQAEVLRELFEALGNDPFVIAECLAGPALAERLVTNFYAHDQRFHGELRQRAEADLLAHPTVEQMKLLSGKFSEIELSKSENGEGETSRAPGHALKLNSREWDETARKLGAAFDTATSQLTNGRDPAVAGRRPSCPAREAVAPCQIVPVGKLSPLQEDEGRYYVAAVIEKTKDRLKLATVEWRKEPLESWRARGENQMPKAIAASGANYTLPAISDNPSGCIDDTWTPTSSTPVLNPRIAHAAVWTGSEMILWGGDNPLSDGLRYNPSTDSWAATSTTNAPLGRYKLTGVWTGKEMIVWGGFSVDTYFDTGGRYNPGTDSWTATSTVNAPLGRELHTAVWSGNEMIVWGGNDDSREFNTGGRYNPDTDSWTATSTVNAPTARGSHSAVWTGNGMNEMIVWGGGGSRLFNTGGRYNPGTDSWTATSTTNAPDPRGDHTAVWTGSEMIVWGGFPGFNTGGRYNPGTDSWTATSTTNAPTARYYHTGLWTGSEMIVWGGYLDNSNIFNTGGRYNPSADSWTATSTANAPIARYWHTAIWSGNEMIIWGGGAINSQYNTGGRYNPSTDSWTETRPASEPQPRDTQATVWTGNEMILWGGFSFDPYHYTDTGVRYNPVTDSWTATSTVNAPIGRQRHTAVWTGNEMIVWGGFPDLNTGGRYNPSTDSWTPTSTTNVIGRHGHTAAWSGNEMIVWGGQDYYNPYLNTGGRYNPGTDSWTATSTTNAPTGRAGHTAVWTNSEMIVWGGMAEGPVSLNTGGRYNPSTDSWIATSITDAPAAREYHTTVWSGSEMIVWGGDSYHGISHYWDTGGRYNPGTDSWIATSTTNAPTARTVHTAVWSGNEMIVWGGNDNNREFNTGGRYNPGTDSWTATSTTNAPTARYYHTTVWSGSEMIVWGGYAGTSQLNTGGRYCAQSGSTPTATPTPTGTPRVTPTPRPRPTPPPRP